MSTTDSQLLARYLDGNDEAAFSQLVTVYGGLVLGAARRITGETEAAKEAAQNTFIMLARKAPSLRGRESLGGWLHHTALLSARNIVRSRRREERKREALKEAVEPLEEGADALWETMRPALDDSLAALPEKDRDALVLRFYRGCSVQEVASAMKVTLAAAQKRLGRALEKLRGNLQRQGVSLSLPALSAGLGMWMSKSPCAAALTTAWAAKAAGQSATVSAGSSLTVSTILTAMTNSKIITTVVAAALLIGGGAIAVHKSKTPSPDPGSQTSAGAGTHRSKDSRPGQDAAGDRMQELEAQFGSERMRQARRIVTLLQAGFRTELEMSLAGLDLMTRGWIEQKQQAWNLDQQQARDLALLVAAEQDGRVRMFKDAVHALGEQRTAAYTEAILLADQVARGELERDEFEAAYERLSRMDSGGLEMQMGAQFRIDSYLLKEEFAAAVEALVPTDQQAAIRQHIQDTKDQIVKSQLAMLKFQVPDLSDEQLDRLEEHVLKVGPFPPKRSLVEDYLTESQNVAWRAKEEERQRQMAQAPSLFHTTDASGQQVILESPRRRTATDGQVPAYPWQDPLTLDAAEKEARKISQGGLFSQSNESAIETGPRREVIPAVRAE